MCWFAGLKQRTLHVRITQTQGAHSQPFGFHGREYDQESGLYYFRARYYDPNAGRFVQSDPLGIVSGQMSLYGMAGENPVNWSDPEGLFRKRISGASKLGAVMAANEVIRRAAVPKIGGATLSLASRIAAALATVSLYGETKKDDPAKKNKCAALAAAKDRAEESMFRGMSCLGMDGLTRPQLESRLYIWLMILEARKASYECHADGDPDHRDQIEIAQRQVRECARRLGL